MFLEQPLEPEVVAGGAPLLRGALQLVRASGHGAHTARQRQVALRSFVPPLLTLLKMSTTTSTVLSSPVTCSMCRSICGMPPTAFSARCTSADLPGPPAPSVDRPSPSPRP